MLCLLTYSPEPPSFKIWPLKHFVSSVSLFQCSTLLAQSRASSTLANVLHKPSLLNGLPCSLASQPHLPSTSSPPPISFQITGLIRPLTNPSWLSTAYKNRRPNHRIQHGSKSPDSSPHVLYHAYFLNPINSRLTALAWKHHHFDCISEPSLLTKSPFLSQLNCHVLQEIFHLFFQSKWINHSLLQVRTALDICICIYMLY